VTIRDDSDVPTAGQAGEASECNIVEWSPAGGLLRWLRNGAGRHHPPRAAEPDAALAELLTISARIGR
jgi:hypothetical protein